MDYSWLDVSRNSFEGIYDGLIKEVPARWCQIAGPDARRIALAGNLASGTDEQVLRSWAREKFPVFCKSGGEKSSILLQDVSESGELTADVIERLSLYFEALPDFCDLTLEQRVALAMIVVDTLGSKRSN